MYAQARMQFFKKTLDRFLKKQPSITPKTPLVRLKEPAFLPSQPKETLHNSKPIWTSNQKALNSAPPVMIIWFEPTVNVRDDYRQIFGKLKEEYQNVQIFTDLDEYVNTFTEIASNSKVYLLMPGMWTAKLLHHLKHMPALRSAVQHIFVYSSSPEQYKSLMEKYSMIRTIYRSIDDVWNEIHQYINQRCEVLRLYDQRNVRELSGDDAIGEFIWFMAFKDALFQLSHDEKGKDELIDVCQRFYANNPSQLMLISEFKFTYRSEDAPKWFSRDAFLYRLVNRALRTQDVEQLYVFRYFIRDLSSYLSNEFREIVKSKEKFYLYRGAALSESDFQSLDSGKLLAPNGFFSTSRDIEVAKCFISSDRSDLVPVLYKIECDMASYTYGDIQTLVPFADISGSSCIKDEREVLFDLGATFEIENIEPRTDENDYIIIHMIPSCEGGHLLRDYREQCQKETENSSAALTFGALLIKTGKYMAAQHYFEQLFNDSNNENSSDVHHCLGWTHMRRGDYGQAIIHFEQAHDVIPQSDSVARARILNSIGKVLVEKGLIKESLSYYKRALGLRKNCPDAKHEEVADSYANVGRLYNLAGSYKLARKYYQKSLETDTYLTNSFEPLNHKPTADDDDSMKCSRSSDGSLHELHHSSYCNSISQSLYELGAVQCKLGRITSGLNNMKRSLHIDKYSSPPSTPAPLRSLHLDGNVAPLSDPDTKEVTYRQCRLKNTRRRQSKTPADEAKDLEKLGSAYAAKEEFDKALECYLSALKLREKQGPMSKPSLDTAHTLNHIGNIHHCSHRLEEALSYYRKALAIYEKFPKEATQDRQRTINKINKTNKIIGKMKSKTDVCTSVEKSMLYRKLTASAPLARRRNNIT